MAPGACCLRNCRFGGPEHVSAPDAKYGMVESHHLGFKGVDCMGDAARPDTVVYSAHLPVCSRLSGLLCTGNRSPVGLCQLSGTLCRIPSLRSLPTSKPFSIRLTDNPDVRHAFEVASSHDLVTSAMTHLRSVHSPRREWQDSNLRYASVCQNWSRSLRPGTCKAPGCS